MERIIESSRLDNPGRNEESTSSSIHFVVNRLVTIVQRVASPNVVPNPTKDSDEV